MDLFQLGETHFINRDHISRIELLSADQARIAFGDQPARTDEKVLHIYLNNDAPVVISGPSVASLFDRLTASVSGAQ